MEVAVLEKSPLFRGMSLDEIEKILPCIDGRTKVYEKGEVIYEIGRVTKNLGIVLEGAVCVSRMDYWGNQALMAYLTQGQLFAETFAILKDVPMTVEVYAGERTKVLFVDVQRILNTCMNQCEFHERLIENLFLGVARKNLSLSEKIEHMSQKTIRGKVLSFLSAQEKLAGKSSFTIPYNRQQLSEYLAVDRSALSAELGRLKKEGYLDYSKNYFVLLKKTE